MKIFYKINQSLKLKEFGEWFNHVLNMPIGKIQYCSPAPLSIAGRYCLERELRDISTNISKRFQFWEKQKLLSWENMNVSKKKNPNIKEMMKKYHCTIKKKGMDQWRFPTLSAHIKTGPCLGLVSIVTMGTLAMTRSVSWNNVVPVKCRSELE